MRVPVTEPRSGRVWEFDLEDVAAAAIEGSPAADRALTRVAILRLLDRDDDLADLRTWLAVYLDRQLEPESRTDGRSDASRRLFRRMLARVVEALLDTPVAEPGRPDRMLKESRKVTEAVGWVADWWGVDDSVVWHALETHRSPKP